MTVRTVEVDENVLNMIEEDPDDYDRCMLLENEALYCSFKYTLQQLHSGVNVSTWNIIKNISSNPYNYRHDILRHSICVPQTCIGIKYDNIWSSDLLEKLADCYNEKYAHLGLKGTITDLECEDNLPKYPVDWIDQAFGLFFLLYLTLVLCATFIDKSYKLNPDDGTYRNKILCAISVPRNWQRLKTIQNTSDIERLRCIQGMRVYTMVLVILSHTVMFSFMMPITNPKFTENLTNRFTAVFLTSGPLSVSTFFMISSWLLTYNLLTSLEHQKEVSFKGLFAVFINRYLRLAPTLALIATFEATWLRHLGNGPTWNHYVGKEYLLCRKNWWTNVLFVNNFINSDNMCMLSTWYLALDTQYFAILLLLIWLIKKFPKYVWWLIATIILIHVTSAFQENYTNDFPAILLPFPESLYDLNYTLKNRQWLVQYISFRGNMGGPLTGLCAGYLYYKYRGRKLFTKKIHNFTWWLISHTLGYGIIIVPGLLCFSRNIEHDRFWASVHSACSRLFFSAGIAFGLFGTTFGAGGVVKHILSWSPLYVLGRLTYSAYLIHFPILHLRNGMMRSPLFITEYYLVFELVGNLMMTYLAATLITLLFEMPLYQLQKVIMHLPKKEIHTEKKKK